MHTSTAASMRSAGITIGGLGVIVLVAISVGAVAAWLAPRNTMLSVALSVTAFSALVSGLAVGLALRRLRRRLEPEVQADATGPISPTGDTADGTGPARY